jgi:hypothetical protein
MQHCARTRHAGEGFNPVAPRQFEAHLGELS